MVPELPLNICLKLENRCYIMILVLVLLWKTTPVCDCWLDVKQNFMAVWTGCSTAAYKMLVEAPHISSVTIFKQQLITDSHKYKNERALTNSLRKLMYGYGVS